MAASALLAAFGVSTRTVQDWEQGRRNPSGSARAFLKVCEREPATVTRALAAE